MDPQEFYINDKELKIKRYQRNIFGTVFLSIILAIGVVHQELSVFMLIYVFRCYSWLVIT